MIKLGLLGKNISKSQAPSLIIKLGKEFEIDLSYELFQDNKIENNFEEFLNFLKQKNFLGVNVTFPYKELAFNFSEIKSPEVDLVKSTNLLLLNQNIISKNTDYIGFSNAYKYNFNSRPSKLLVLGGGGVGKAICFALIKLGIKELYIIEKDNLKLTKLVKDLKHHHDRVFPINLDEVISKKEEFDGFLNCSEMGHFNTPGNPFSGLELNKNQWAFDAIYTPAITSFLEKSKEDGAKIISGIDLFLFQGIESFIIFTEQEKLRKKIMSNYDKIREYYFKKLIT